MLLRLVIFASPFGFMFLFPQNIFSLCLTIDQELSTVFASSVC